MSLKLTNIAQNCWKWLILRPNYVLGSQKITHGPMAHPSGSATARKRLSPKYATPDDCARACRSGLHIMETYGSRTDSSIPQTTHFKNVHEKDVYIPALISLILNYPDPSSKQ